MTAPLRTAALAACIAAVPLTALASPRPFAGPAGWDHTVGAAATPQSARALESWKKSDAEVVTYLTDPGLSYDDMVGLVKKNVSDNGLKPSLNVDRTCAGRRAHELEMTLGTMVVHQMIVDDAPGVTKVTYTRAQGVPAAPDAVTALTSYCAATQ